MYRHNVKQFPFDDFFLPFGGHLRGDNRWIRLSEEIPWELVEDLYVSKLRTNFGAPAHAARMAFGSLLIKERLGLSDEETVAQITENPYLQYFIGLKEFQKKAPFDSSQMVYFRKRFTAEAIDQINEAIAVAKVREHMKENDDSPSTDDTPPNDSSSSRKDEPKQPEKKTKNEGKLLVDATCTPADVAYPTDLNLLNTAREKAEKIIDVLHGARTDRTRKPRTYRKKARKQYLTVARSKRPGQKKVRKAIGQQLRFLHRDLGHIDTLAGHVSLTVLPPRQYRDLLVINEVYRQQKVMYDSKTRRIEDRIVSISQPHIRPIKRGKVVADTEFGAKVSISLVHGYAFTERISWDNFNEGIDLIGIIKKYHKRFDVYPKSVHVDKIYRNRENLKYCRTHGIRLSGPPLGRPRKETSENHEELKAAKRQTRQDELDRIPVEGKFGQGKRRFGLGRIMAKLANTSTTVITLNILVMNLEKLLKAALSSLLFVLWLYLVAPLYEAVQRFSATFRRHRIIRLRSGLMNGAVPVA